MPELTDRARAAAPGLVTLGHGSALAVQLWDDGTPFAIRHGDILVNQVLGSPVEGGLGNIHLRRRRRAGMTSFPLLGPASGSAFRVSREGNAAAWEGAADGLAYVCTLRLAVNEPTWFWTVAVTNQTRRPASIDVVFAQDLGLAMEAAVRTSERYASQYIDHTVLQDADLGFLVASRQNLEQGGAFPWVLHGCLDGAAGFLTDGFQFYGTDVKATGVAAALARRTLPNRRLQGELAMPTLQSRALTLAPGAVGEMTFFAAFVADHPTASGPADAELARDVRGRFEALTRDAITNPVRRPAPGGRFAAPTMFESQDLDEADLERHFGPRSAWRHVERADGALRSFFHGRQLHVVLRAKERIVERPTGHIVRSGTNLLPDDDTLSVTSWMTGVFGSQLTIGNTSFHKLLSVVRDPLNILKSSGQRIFVRTAAGDQLLGLPSAFEMGPTGARWIYRGDRHTIAVRVAASLDAPAWCLTVEVERGGPLELVITHDIVLGTNEGDTPGQIVIDGPDGPGVRMTPARDGGFAQHYPEATYWLVSPDADALSTIERDGSHVVVTTRPTEHFSVVITGSILSAARADERAAVYRGRPDPDATKAAAADGERWWTGLGRGASLGGANGRTAAEITRLDDLIPWYLHDALIHATVPHGLEQYSGAAWAVRDVSQGPVEWLIATRQHDTLREVVRRIYEAQYHQTGDWPQWFMVDRYRDIQAVDSHADIVHWPLKALCDYIEATDDLAVLDTPVAWTDRETRSISPETDPLFAHTERQVERIERDVVPGTALPMFGGGDWEDTLQPVDSATARRLVSAWTVELAIQTLSRYRIVCERAGRAAMATRLTELVDRMRADFDRCLVPDGVVAGLAHFGPDGVEVLLHPRDERTGVSYRLLPMTRGIISGVFDAEQAERHRVLIERHLTFPDGVRLMDRPMAYRGGVSTIFKRAESAAYFGREVGLQYVHAHIRYIEAMCRLGRAEEAWAGLLAVCPIGIAEAVPNALPRQANAYFSSSDADFADRDEASRHFGRLKSGKVGVKGGWRVYSSGPGIYLNQLISNVLGLRLAFDDVVFDPVLPARADGLTFDFELLGRPARFVYRVSGAGDSPRAIRINGHPLPTDRREANPYRPGGMLVSRREVLASLHADANLVEIDV
ncbi:MAG: GH36-type glycosyl hydrolase domain-containing protein [Candidatus Limnocylindrales bacterium]